MLKELWQWWMEGLAGPWPGPVRGWLRGRGRLVRAVETREGFEFAARRGGAWRVVWRDAPGRSMPGRLRRRLRAADIVLAMPGDAVLQRSVAIPAHVDAAAHVEQRLGELSPFPESETCFDTIQKDESSEPVLIIARRTDIDGRLGRLRERGLPVRAVTAAGLEDTSLDLTPAGHGAAPRRDPAGAALFAAGLVACAVGVVLPVVEQQRAIERLEAEHRRWEDRLAEAADTREALRRLRGRAETIAERVAGAPDAVTLLAAVTRAVPDHSWLRQLVLHDGSLTLHGESRDTADLIARLEASPELHNVRYDTAITRDADSGTDRFKLTAELGGTGS